MQAPVQPTLTDTPWAVRDDDCSDGSFAVAAISVAVGLYPVVVSATDAAGNNATATIKTAKAVVIGQPNGVTNQELATGGMRRPH